MNLSAILYLFRASEIQVNDASVQTKVHPILSIWLDRIQIKKLNKQV